MHLFFENLVVIGVPRLHASLMDIHHDTSFRAILEDDSISLASKARIHFCSGNGVGLWLVARPFICSFCIAHFTFTSMTCFCFGLIQLLTSSFFMCECVECGHGLDASNMHLTCCPFRGQRIATRDAIRDIMYAFTQESGHTIWRERWYTFTLGASLRADLYMTREDQVFVTNVVVIDLT
jgi:hypothetical protein